MANAQWGLILESLSPLLYLAAVALIVTILIHAKAVLVPVALAVMLAFILTPVVETLERYRFPRMLAVAVVVLCMLGVIGGFGYVVNQQFNDLAAELPRYSTSIKEKFATLRESRKGAIANIQKTVEEVTRELDEQEQKKEARTKASSQRLDVKTDVQPVRIVPAEPGDVERFRRILEPVFAPLAMAGVVLILVSFMLMQREDLRNRFIRLVGQGRLSHTTKMMDEAGRRVSRFLLTQCVINASVGAVVTAGLWVIGVPYAALWGVTAALLRFAPYVGSFLALLLPTALAFVLFEGWGHTLATLGLFLCLDMLTAYVAEPLVIGHNTGVSSLALLLMALFWTWVWGPLGLLLSVPFTVCLVVLGNHVPQLEFLAVLLGDAPALEPEISFYQRLLAGDNDEANEIVEQNLQRHAPAEVFDEVLVPALLLAASDRTREQISEAEQTYILQEIHEAVHRLAEAHSDTVKAHATTEESLPGNKSRARIFLIPARSEEAQIAADMLSQLLDPFTCELRRFSTATLASEVVTRVDQEQPDLLCITALPPGGLAHARYLCKRLRGRFPQVRILVVRPGLQADPNLEPQAVIQRLTEAGADKVATSVTEVRSHIAQILFPLLVQSVEPETTTPEVMKVAMVGSSA